MGNNRVHATGNSSLAQAVRDLIGTEVTTYTTDTGTGYQANGNSFYLFHTSKASPEHIAMCLSRKTYREHLNDTLTEEIPEDFQRLLDRLS